MPCPRPRARRFAAFAAMLHYLLAHQSIIILLLYIHSLDRSTRYIYIPTTGQSILSIGKHASSSVGEAVIDSRRPVYIHLSSTSASDLFAWISVLYTLIFSILFEILVHVFYQSSVYSVCIKPYTFVFSIFNINFYQY